MTSAEIYREEGREEIRRKVAKKLILSEFSTEDICYVTELTEEDVWDVKKEIVEMYERMNSEIIENLISNGMSSEHISIVTKFLEKEITDLKKILR